MEKSEISEGIEEAIAKMRAEGRYVEGYREACVRASAFSYKVKKPRFLDLGCGVYTTTGRPSHESWHTPDRCESSHKSGWDVTGIDIHPLGRDLSQVGWNFIQGDILDPKFMGNALGDNYFDLVYSDLLITLCAPRKISPSLQLPNGEHPYQSARTVSDLQQNTEYRTMLEYFFTQVARVLRPSGMAIINDDYVLKKAPDGRLRMLFRRDGEIVLPTGDILQTG